MDRFGLHKAYILSPAWGLSRADFLTPYYDITFSQSAEDASAVRNQIVIRISPCCRIMRKKKSFLGGKDYVPLLCSLTAEVRSHKILFWNSARAPEAAGWTLKRFDTRTRTKLALTSRWQKMTPFCHCCHRFLPLALGHEEIKKAASREGSVENHRVSCGAE